MKLRTLFSHLVFSFSLCMATPLPSSLAAGPGDKNFCEFSGAIDFAPTPDPIDVTASKMMALYAAKKDLKGFCEWNRMDRATGFYLYKRSDEAIQEYRHLKSLGDRDAAAKHLIGDSPRNYEYSRYPLWQISLLGHPYLKRNTPIASAFAQLQSNSRCRKVDCLAGPMIESLEKTSGLESLPFKGADIAEEHFDFANTKLSLACTYVDSLAVFGCNSASKELLELLKVWRVSDSDVTLTGKVFYERILRDSTHKEPLYKASLELWQRISQEEFSSQDSVFGLLQTAYLESGFSSQNAKINALTVLGLISTGGGNLGRRLWSSGVVGFPDKCMSYNGCNFNAIYLTSIAEGIVLADTIKMQKHPVSSPYSLPAQAQFSCDSGKWYHFWFPALLVHELMSRGHSARAASAAVFASHIGYHVKPPSVANDRETDLLGFARYGTLENGIRIDIALASAGVYYGSTLFQGQDPESLPIKDAFLKMMEDGGEKPTPEKKSRYLSEEVNVYKWLENLSPKSAFYFFK